MARSLPSPADERLDVLPGSVVVPSMIVATIVMDVTLATHFNVFR